MDIAVSDDQIPITDHQLEVARRPETTASVKHSAPMTGNEFIECSVRILLYQSLTAERGKKREREGGRTGQLENLPVGLVDAARLGFRAFSVHQVFENFADGLADQRVIGLVL